MLYNEHSKAAKELQRKIEKLKADGVDPSLPQQHDLPKVPPPRQNSNSRTGPPRVNTSSPQPIGRPMSDSNTGDESFMLLGGQRVCSSLHITCVLHFQRSNNLTCSPTTHLLSMHSQILGMPSTNSGTSCRECWTIFPNLSRLPLHLWVIRISLRSRCK